MSNMSVTKTRLQRLLDERVLVSNLHDDVIAGIEGREDDKDPTDIEKQQLEGYRERMQTIDTEVDELHTVLKREDSSASTSKVVRAHLAGQAPGVISENGEVRYRTFAAYARDKMIVRFDQIAASAGGDPVKAAARERLMRAPQHTLTDDIAGLLPPQHIAQIFDVINKSRPIVATARSVNLDKGKLTYPKITQRPQVLLQVTEKTEGGTADLKVSMEDVLASTYIGGGNLSWQAINWSTPSALELWFDLAAEAYAKKTETHAADVLDAAATSSGTVSSPVLGTSTFPVWVSAIVRAAADVYEDSGAMADTIYFSPDMFFAAALLTSDQGASLINAGQLNLGSMGGNIAGMSVVTSYGLGASTVIVGDSSAFLVAETAGAPVELRAVEPAIGGMEVGLIGAFAAEAVDVTRFARASA